jgi:hypothetical protein
MKTKRSTECAVLMGLGACHGCASGSKLALHVDFRPQIYRVRIFCGGQAEREEHLVTIDLSSPTQAMVKVQMRINQSVITDYLAMFKLAQEWRIVSKTYYRVVLS